MAHELARDLAHADSPETQPTLAEIEAGGHANLSG